MIADPLAALEATCRTRAESELAKGMTYAWAVADKLLWRVKLMRLFGSNQAGPKGRLP